MSIKSVSLLLVAVVLLIGSALASPVVTASKATAHASKVAAVKSAKASAKAAKASAKATKKSVLFVF